jgi:dCTP deaminase
MIVQDYEIQRLCLEQKMVAPYDVDLLNPASLDLRIGDNIMVDVAHSTELQRQSIAHNTRENPYLMQPGEFLLAETLEVFNMPQDICGLFCLKSSRAREGYEHSHAGYADCGWTGSRLTLELKNNRRFTNLPLYPGLKIGQMVFFLMLNIPDIDYGKVGHYNGQPQVMPSWEDIAG